MSVLSQNKLRFAPSPTGYLHIGNARTLILNYIFAKSLQGDLILRILSSSSTCHVRLLIRPRLELTSGRLIVFRADNLNCVKASIEAVSAPDEPSSNLPVVAI